MTKADLLNVLENTEKITLHLDDGKSVFGKVIDVHASLIHIEQLDQSGNKLNDVMIPLTKIAALVIDLPAVKPDAPIDV